MAARSLAKYHRPQSTPVYFGRRRSTESDAERELKKASRYIDNGGEWSDELRAFVDRWLDVLLLRHQDAAELKALSKGLPAAAGARR